ncbi:MAG: hypothetical protein REI64_05835 [Pedobacter sp.]|uniref:hypothetical protein n=1 Tax=Pedobacter sp. TaxID=1411316 RepID=UPI00280A0BD7|nr:hypothetical protein [Pedobacter sp.]MDQ8004301.1 hypothetical protein [Pedobacter sp.]
MKIIASVFILVFINLGLYAQTEVISITGEIVDRKSTYAYVGFGKEIFSAKIINKDFKITLPKKEGYELGAIFFWSDSLSNEQAYQMIKNGLEDSRTIAIENLYIVAGKVAKEAIVKGGQYNLELDEMFLCLRNKSYLDFFDKYPNSPVSLTLLRILIGLAKTAPYFKGELTLKIYFDKLSNELKGTEQGKKLWTMIAPMYKN